MELIIIGSVIFWYLHRAAKIRGEANSDFESIYRDERKSAISLDGEDYKDWERDYEYRKSEYRNKHIQEYFGWHNEDFRHSLFYIALLLVSIGFMKIAIILEN